MEIESVKEWNNWCRSIFIIIHCIRHGHKYPSKHFINVLLINVKFEGNKISLIKLTDSKFDLNVDLHTKESNYIGQLTFYLYWTDFLDSKTSNSTISICLVKKGPSIGELRRIKSFYGPRSLLKLAVKKPNDTFISNRNAESEDFSPRSIVFWQRSYSIYSNEESVATTTEYFKDRSST